MQVGDLVYVKGARRLGIALITKCRVHLFGKADYLIRWSTENPERHDFMYIYEAHLELVSENRR